MIFFLDKTLHRYTYTQTNTGLYGETIKEYVHADDIIVDFQNENNNELAHTYGVDLQNLYKIYIDLNVEINDTDQLRDDEGNTYHIIGNIRNYSKYHKYKKANLILERRVTDGS